MKKINFKKIAALILAAALAAPMAACSKSSSSSSTLDTIKKNGYITMSTNAEFEPFEYMENGEAVGIDVEIGQKIADKLGVKLKVRNVDFSALAPELSSDKGDFVAAGMTVTDDRKKNMDFTDTYYEAAQSIIVKKGSDIKTREGLAGKTAGVQEGTTGDLYCTDDDGKSDVKVGTTKRYNKGADAVTDLLNGKIDAVVIDDFPAIKFVSKNPDKLVKLDDALTVEKYAIAVKKGNKELLDTINGVIKEMKSNGEIEKIADKYKQSYKNS